MELSLLKDLDFRTTRALQIGVVFFCTLVIQWMLNFKHSAWIGFSVMMIYAGFDTGTSIHRTFHRFLGMSLGLILSWLLWGLGMLNYRILFLVIPMIIFFSFFSLGKLYAIPTIFTVTLTALGTDYFSPLDYQVRNFFFDYFWSTCVAFGICIVFETIVFRKKNLTHLFYLEAQQQIIIDLEKLFVIIKTKPLRERAYLKVSVECNEKIMEFERFVSMSMYDYHIQQNQFTKLEEFNTLLQEAYFMIRSRFVRHSVDHAPLDLQIEGYLERLHHILKQE